MQAREAVDAAAAMEVPSEAALEMVAVVAVVMVAVVMVVVKAMEVGVKAMEEAETTVGTAARGLQSPCVVNTAMYHPCSGAYRR